jgi:hypothetical protein
VIGFPAWNSLQSHPACLRVLALGFVSSVNVGVGSELAWLQARREEE